LVFTNTIKKEWEREYSNIYLLLIHNE